MRRAWNSIFIWHMLIIGSILVFIIPPIQVPDENVHFLNAYAFSEGDFFPSFEGDSYLGRVFPTAVVEYQEYWNYGDQKRATIENVYENESGKIDKTQLSFY